MTPHEIEIAFSQAIADAGLGDTLIPADGKLHRFKVPADKGRQRTGWAVLHADGLPAGVVGDWRTGEETRWKAAGKAVELSKADRREVEALRRKREAALEDTQQRAATKAAALYERLPAASADHPYLARKKIPAGLCKVTTGGALVVSVHDVRSNEIISLQFIRSDGEKRFLTGGRTAGGCCFLGAHASKPVVICEGYATGQAIQESVGPHVNVTVAFNAGNIFPIAQALRERLPDRDLFIAADNDTATPGNPGVTKATEAAEAVGARLIVPSDPGDFNDLYLEHGAEAVIAMFVPDTPEAPDNVINLFPSPDEAVERLAALPTFEYEQERLDAANRLGVRVTVLDKTVKAKQDDTDTRQGRALELPEPDLWNEPVDGDALLDGLRAAIERYVVLPPHTSAAIALWVVHTYAIDETHHTPRLLFASPEMRCGKTTALNVLRRLVLRALQAANISTAAVYRTVEAMKPTLLIDEADTFLAKSDELRGVVNSGHERGGAVIKVEGENNEPRIFATFAATAIAGIGKMPGTIEDRSIIIRMRRRKPSEYIKRLRGDRAPELDELASMAARWVADHRIALKNVDVDPPAVLSDRAADGWRPLIGIADLCGGDWPEIACQAAVALSGYPDDDESIRIMLLRDIRSIFDSGGQDKIPSEALASDLHEMEERPWSEFGRAQKPITKIQVARFLKPFGIAPATIRTAAGATPKGYRLDQFLDAFERYLPDDPAETKRNTPQPAENCDKLANRNATFEFDVADRNPRKPTADKGCGVVVGQTPPERGNGAYMPDAEDLEAERQEREAIQAIDGEAAVCGHCGELVGLDEESVPCADGRKLHARCYEPHFGFDRQDQPHE